MNILYDFIDATNKEKILYKRFAKALQVFVDKYLCDNWEVIIIGGSFAKNKITANSDIDVVVVLTDGSSESESFKEVRIDDIPIQLFKFTAKELYDSFNWEKGNLQRQRSSLLSSGVIVSGNSEVGKKVIANAKIAFNEPIQKLSLENAQSMINFINNQIPNNMNQLFDKTKYGFMISLNGMMDRYFNLLHQINSKSIPLEKEIDSDLSSIPDIESGKLFCSLLVEENLSEKKDKFYDLSRLLCKRLNDYIKANYKGK